MLLPKELARENLEAKILELLEKKRFEIDPDSKARLTLAACDG
ncbi:MAG: hypothetical protein WC340_08460 [Kiritimatiellia bacterium]|jgi:hypothetical protein